MLAILSLLLLPTDDLQASAVQAISTGVQRVHSGENPGRVLAYGPDAFPVLTFEDGATFAAAGSLGKGRFVVFGDHQTLTLNSHGDEADHAAMVLGAMAWSLGREAGDEDIKAAKVAVFEQGDADWLKEKGFRTVAVVPRNRVAAVTREADLILGWLGSSIGDRDAAAVAAFVKAGKGVVLAEYGPGYKMWWTKTPLSDAPAAKVLREAGVAFPAGSRGERGVMPVKPAAGRFGLAEAEAALKGGTPAEFAKAAGLISDLDEVFGRDRSPAKSLRQTMLAELPGRVPRATEDSPVSDPAGQELLTVEARVLRDLPFEEVTAHPTAEAVYGRIPADAGRAAHTVTVDTSVPKWRSTGLYAVPGELVTVKVPRPLIGKGCEVRLSGHVDNVSPRKEWKRVPFGVSPSVPLDKPVVTIASAFGGAVYLDMTEEPPAAGDVKVTIENVIEAPHFVLGETTDEDWVKTERGKPAPFAELDFGRLIISLPSAWVRDVRRMERLGEYWDGVVAEQDRVLAVEGLRTFPERINVDVQISAGLLHAGVPIQGPYYASRDLVNYDKLTAQGDWGYFHELGHEHQRRVNNRTGGWQNPWTFEGDGEVTVNIFANAALEKFPGALTLTRLDNPFRGWGWSAFPSEVMRRALKTTDEKTPFEEKNPYPFYFQLADGFGPDGFREVFATYRDDAANDRTALPRDNRAEKDQWLIRWSRVHGVDMTDYMAGRWGLEVSDAAKAAVAKMNLPTWLPAVGGLDSARAVGPLPLPLKEKCLSYDGVAAVSNVEASEGRVRPSGKGVWTFTPPRGSGVAEVTYDVTSSTGHAVRSTTYVKYGR